MLRAYGPRLRSLRIIFPLERPPSETPYLCRQLRTVYIHGRIGYRFVQRFLASCAVLQDATFKANSVPEKDILGPFGTFDLQIPVLTHLKSFRLCGPWRFRRVRAFKCGDSFR